MNRSKYTSGYKRKPEHAYSMGKVFTMIKPYYPLFMDGSSTRDISISREPYMSKNAMGEPIELVVIIDDFGKEHRMTFEDFKHCFEPLHE